jgi:anti-sigma factor RsiW
MNFRRSRLEQRIEDYVAGDLDEAAAREVERRIAGDATARALYEQAREAHEALATLRERPEPPVGADEVLPTIRAAISEGQFAPRPRLELEGQGARYYRRIAMAASVLFAVTAGILIATGAFSDSPAPPRVVYEGPLPSEEAPLEVHDAYELMERLRREGRSRLRRVVPIDGVVPISAGAAERR